MAKELLVSDHKLLQAPNGQSLGAYQFLAHTFHEKRKKFLQEIYVTNSKFIPSSSETNESGGKSEEGEGGGDRKKRGQEE